MTDYTKQIEQLSEERQRLWHEGGQPEAVAAITKRINDAYEARRIERATARFGDATTIIKRARIETELERLMSSE